MIITYKLRCELGESVSSLKVCAYANLKTVRWSVNLPAFASDAFRYIKFVEDVVKEGDKYLSVSVENIYQ